MVLLWVNNHFNDFEMQSEMTDFLEKFEQLLEKEVSCRSVLLFCRICEAIYKKSCCSKRNELHCRFQGGFIGILYIFLGTFIILDNCND